MDSAGRVKPTISVQNPTGASKLIRDPSRESISTEISVGSVASCLDSKLCLKSMEQKSPSLRVSFRCSSLPLHRGPSPSPCLSDRLAVPSASTRASSPGIKSAKDIWLDDENDLIRSCGALSRALGLEKSFSTSDILTATDSSGTLRPSRSETFLLDTVNLHFGKLEPNSRSLSTWVAVGDVQSSTSQLPSPQVELNKGFPECGAQFTAADFVRSVNKSVRQSYIKKRLKVTYKALEQLAESGFDLDRVEKSYRKNHKDSSNKHKSSSSLKEKQSGAMAKVLDTVQSGLSDIGGRGNDNVSQKEIERDRGKPISKFERNVMIFDWLHTLDESATYDAVPTTT